MLFYSVLVLVGIAQEIGISLDREELLVGVPFGLVITATGFAENPQPEIDEFQISGASVSLVSVQPSVSRQISIVNGRRSMSEDVRYVYKYAVQTTDSGSYTVPPITARQGTTQATSAGGKFTVQEPKTTNDFAIEVVLEDTTLWLGQKVPVYIDLFLKRDVGDLDLLLPLLDVVDISPTENSRQMLEFTGQQGSVQLPYTQDLVDRKGEQVTRIRAKGILTATKSGQFHVPSAKAIAQLVTKQQRGFMGFPQNEYTTFQSKDKEFDLTVSPLPLQNRPNSFAGLVGKAFSLQVRASKTVVSVGEPITIDIEIRGDGDLEGMQLPAFDDVGFSKLIETPNQNPLGVVNPTDHSKTFSFPIRLREGAENLREIPILQISYFDPDSAEYKTVYSQPVAISVSGVAASSVQVITNNTQQNETTSNTERPSTQMGANLQMSTEAEQNNSVQSLSTSISIGVAIQGLLFALFAGKFWLDSTKSARETHKQKKASVHKLHELRKQAPHVPIAQIAKELLQAVQEYKREYPAMQQRIAEIVENIEIEMYAPDAHTKPLSAGVCAKLEEL